MPQLDKFSFFDQTFCLFVLLILIYILNVYVFLPRFMFILIFRERIYLNLKKKQHILYISYCFLISTIKYTINFKYNLESIKNIITYDNFKI